MPAPDASQLSEDHLGYVRRLLDGARDPDAAEEFLYAIRTEGKPGFWELLGFRVSGLSWALVGAAHFHAQSDDPLVFARRSLGHFLSSPPQVVGIDRASYPADLVELRVSRAGESLPDLLGRLRYGRPTASVYLDAGLVDLAFDFRPRAGAFVVLTGVQQLLPDRALRLPTIVVHRTFLTIIAEAPAEGDDSALPVPLSPDTANPFHLLDPRLGT
ncbi:MAG: hypothetical protein ACLF0P_02910 [Thermoanaerobaculia bacterium]